MRVANWGSLNRFAIFMLLTIFGQLVQQIMPNFVTQRSLYEARERPAKTYSWKAFMLSKCNFTLLAFR